MVSAKPIYQGEKGSITLMIANTMQGCVFNVRIQTGVGRGKIC